MPVKIKNAVTNDVFAGVMLDRSAAKLRRWLDAKMDCLVVNGVIVPSTSAWYKAPLPFWEDVPVFLSVGRATYPYVVSHANSLGRYKKQAELKLYLREVGNVKFIETVKDVAEHVKRNLERFAKGE